MRSARLCLSVLAAPLLTAGLALAGGPGNTSPRTMSGVLAAPVGATAALRAPFTARVSVTNAGRQVEVGGYAGRVSDNGRFVMLMSTQDGPARVRDRWTHTTQIVSRGPTGRPVATDWAEM